MATYKVITLAMAVKHNRIARFGETVDDSELTLNPSELIKEGFIEEIELEKVVLEALETEEVMSLKKSVEDAEQALKDLPKDADKQIVDEAKLALKNAKLALKEATKK